MEALFQKVSISEDQSIFVKDTFNTHFHFHGEYELIYFSQGHGECIVGDRITKYEEGNLFLIAPNLPHCFTSAPGTISKSLVVQFKHKVFNNTIEQHPELHASHHLLEQGKRGLLFKSPEVFPQADLVTLNGFNRFITLLKILNTLATSTFETLSGPAYIPNIKMKDYHRINEVYEFISHNFGSKISLDNIADRMHMTTSAFCRYFKKITKKSFFTYLNEYRVGKACGMLIHTDKSISAIGFESGFESIANFNRQFKKYAESNPRAYRKFYGLKSQK
ncbi:MAG: helix-turn-helix domain-containing protein [Reichenbachiella sp.]